MMVLNWVDYTLLSILLLSIITGIFRGFVKELIALCIWALAIWLGYHYASSLAPYFQGWVEDSRLRFGIGFILVMIATLISGGLVNVFLGYILKKSGLSAMDRVLGMGFGFVRGVFIAAMVLVVMQMTSLDRHDAMKKSQLAPQFEPVTLVMKSYVPDLVQKIKHLDSNYQLVYADPLDPPEVETIDTPLTTQ